MEVFALLNRVAWEGLNKEAMTEQRHEGSEGTSQGKEFQDQGMTSAKNLGQKCVMCSWSRGSKGEGSGN